MNEWLNFTVLKIGNYDLRIIQVIFASLVIIISYFIIKLLRLYFRKLVKKDKVDLGRSQAYIQLIKYFLLVIAISLILRILGIDVTIFLAGSAALLVGLGLGIQKIFNDVVSGIIILIEGTLKIQDIIETEGIVGEVVNIGLRTSKILTRDDIIIIVPNSWFVSEKVINWTHNNIASRFSIDVGLPYGNDPKAIKDLLAESAYKHPDIEKKPEPFVRLSDFGDSAMLFTLLFYSKNMFRIENTKSDLRCSIYDNLKEKGISIPFPQRDIHIIDKNKD